MNLPLLERAKEDGDVFLLTTDALSAAVSTGATCGIASNEPQSLIPNRALQPGEQYRFHFDMTKCIGCKCCVVACNEQNGNPAEINWRRVGEIEGGTYPDTSRFYLSMGCNHCVEPTCLPGCPVNAYTKDPLTGIVLHSAERCIGCQYCTWNCSYGVPQYNPERGVIGKCDMCHGRLAEGREPACVNACPEGAIQIEIVNVADWKQNYANTANAPGMPSADDSISSTRITLPERLPHDMRKVDMYRVLPEHPHWPLVMMTVLTQMSVGALGVLFFLQFRIGSHDLRVTAVLSVFIAAIALAASTLHLGRPIHAYRALSMWRRSWLSREVLLFSIFSAMAFFYAGSLWLDSNFSFILGACTLFSGLGGVYASARLYMVPARPAWNSKHTMLEFYFTGILLGSLFVVSASYGNTGLLSKIVAFAVASIFLQQVFKLLWLMNSDTFELRGSQQLLSGILRNHILFRMFLLFIVGTALPLLKQSRMEFMAALLIAIGSEILGRHLFFVSVVPKNVATTYLHHQEVA
ncbi:MAG: DmsC/YnfH family molybdoenzyme membrane anchor subunit [Acidobacteriaceae bacterium]